MQTEREEVVHATDVPAQVVEHFLEELACVMFLVRAERRTLLRNRLLDRARVNAEVAK